MNIGIDIDGVIADSLQTWVRELNRRFNQKKTVQEIITYQFEKVYNVSWAEMNDFFRTNQQLLLSNLAPVSQAGKYLRLLKKNHQIHLITARPNLFRKLTEKWLSEHQITYDQLIMTDFGDKTQYCRYADIPLVVEDSLENAVSLVENGIRVILFDAPYNQGSLPNGIVRREDWRQVYRTISEAPLNQRKPPEGI